MPPPHKVGDNALMAVVYLSAPLSLFPCVTLSRKWTGVGSRKLAEGSPWPVTPFRGRKVKVTRPHNTTTDNEPYLRNGKAYELQT